MYYIFISLYIISKIRHIAKQRRVKRFIREIEYDAYAANNTHN